MTIFIEKSDFDSKMRNICVKREKIVHDKACFNFFSITHRQLSFRIRDCALCLPDLFIILIWPVCLDSQRILSPFIPSPS